MTSISTRRDLAVTCFDLTMPVGWMVSPGLTGLTQRVSRRRWMAPAGQAQSVIMREISQTA
jgi:hypothetical protein